MNSKEALKKLSNDLGNYSPFQRKINIIKKDLERLEKLEKENKELNRQLDVFFDKLDNNTLRAFDLISYELKDENDKLKKVIEILKRKMIIVKLRDNEYIIRGNEYITKEQCDLLKGVFRNVKINK